VPSDFRSARRHCGGNDLRYACAFKDNEQSRRSDQDSYSSPWVAHGKDGRKTGSPPNGGSPAMFASLEKVTEAHAHIPRISARVRPDTVNASARGGRVSEGRSPRAPRHAAVGAGQHALRRPQDPTVASLWLQSAKKRASASRRRSGCACARARILTAFPRTRP